MASPTNQSFKSIPPPLYSDGNVDSLVYAMQNGMIAVDQYVGSFFQSVLHPLLELCMTFPREFNLPMNLNMQNFEPGVAFQQLPRNYGLFSQPSTGHLLVVGHPRSGADMLPHLAWLANPDRFQIPCQCRLCATQVNYGTPVKTDLRVSSGYSNGGGYSMDQNHYNQAPSFQNYAMSGYPSSEFAQPMSFNQPSPLPLDQSQKQIESNYAPPTPRAAESPSANFPTHLKSAESAYMPPSSTPVKPPKMPDPVMSETPSSQDDLKFKAKYQSALVEADNMEKELEKIQGFIANANRNIKRLKFEKRMLLGAITSGDPASSKRAMDESSENDSIVFEMSDIEPEIESEVDDDDGDQEFGADQTPKTRQRKKRMKLLDPNAPKRPANAFILFCELQRMCIKEERRRVNKHAPGSETDSFLANLTKALGARWRQLTEEDRRIYQDMFKDLVKQYDADLAEYMSLYPNAPLQDAEVASLPQGWTDPDAPKRPANAFFVFCEMEDERLKAERKMERTPSEEEEELKKIGKSLGERWRLLPEDERQIYIKKYEEQLKTYRDYMDAKIASIRQNAPIESESSRPVSSEST